VTELLGADLAQLLSSRVQPLKKQVIHYFVYQMLVSIIVAWSIGPLKSVWFQRGLKYVHSAGVVHRDLVSTQAVLAPSHLRLLIICTETEQYLIKREL
jgi:serine/threonine protein kinase